MSTLTDIHNENEFKRPASNDGAVELDYDMLDRLRQNNPAWRLLRAEHAPLIASFLRRAFIAPNQRLLMQGRSGRLSSPSPRRRSATTLPTVERPGWPWRSSGCCA